MAKKKNIDNEEDKKNALLKAIDDLKKSDPTLSDSDIEALRKAVDEIIVLDNEGKIKKTLRALAGFLLKYIVMYISLLIVGSIFMNQMVINRYYIFLALAIAAIPYTMLHSAHIFGVRYWDKSFLPKFLIAEALFILMVYLISKSFIPVFVYPSYWVAILIGGSIMYMIVDYFLSTRVSFY